LVPAQRCDDSSPIGELNLVHWVRGEQSLKDSDGRIEDNGALNTSLDADMHLAVIDELGAHALDVRRRGRVEVGGT
jgi:hypothetical protein